MCMRSILSSLVLLSLLLASTAFSQQQINPATQIRWPGITGSGAPSSPTWPCTYLQYGELYTDITNNNAYFCSTSGWVRIGSTTATSLSGGALGSVPYQSAPSTTTFISSPTTTGQTYVLAWQPSGSAVAPFAFNLLGTANTWTAVQSFTTAGYPLAASNTNATAANTGESAAYFLGPNVSTSLGHIDLDVCTTMAPPFNCGAIGFINSGAGSQSNEVCMNMIDNPQPVGGVCVNGFGSVGLGYLSQNVAVPNTYTVNVNGTMGISAAPGGGSSPTVVVENSTTAGPNTGISGIAILAPAISTSTGGVDLDVGAGSSLTTGNYGAYSYIDTGINVPTSFLWQGIVVTSPPNGLGGACENGSGTVGLGYRRIDGCPSTYTANVNGTLGASGNIYSTDGIVYSGGTTSGKAACTQDGTNCPSSGTGISGLTAGYLPLAGSSTTLTSNSHLDDGITNPVAITSTETLIIPQIIGEQATSGGSVDVLEMLTSTPATSSTNAVSTSLGFYPNYWNGTVTTRDHWRVEAGNDPYPDNIPVFSINYLGDLTNNGAYVAINTGLAENGPLYLGASTLSATAINLQSTALQYITLSSNATPSITGITNGSHVVFEICQPSSGGPYTWTWPASVHGGMTIGTAANTCSIQAFDSFNSTTLVPESAGVTGVAP